MVEVVLRIFLVMAREFQVFLKRHFEFSSISLSYTNLHKQSH